MLRPVMRNAARNAAKSVVGTRYTYNMDGIDDRWTLANRAINVDSNIDIEFLMPSNVAAGGNDRSIVYQSTVSGSAREFDLYISSSSGNFGLNIGGNIFAVGLAGTFAAGEKCRWVLNGNTSNFYNSAGLQRTISITRGATREPSAPTLIGCRNSGGTFRDFFIGVQRDLKINGVLWPMATKNQPIQLPEPSGLGAELITQSVLENPAVKDSQWTYLGNGRWQYIGDGTLNVLSFLAVASQPAQGFVEFEVESISGNMTCTIGAVASSVFNAVGVFRYFYTSAGSANANLFQLKRAGSSVASCVIKNISFKPLGTCNPMTGSNLNPDRWTEVPL